MILKFGDSFGLEGEGGLEAMLGVGCWVLGVGCWMLDVGCWMLDVGCWMLDVGCWMLDVGCWVLDVGCWMLDVGCWMLDVVGLGETGLDFFNAESQRSQSERRGRTGVFLSFG